MTCILYGWLEHKEMVVKIFEMGQLDGSAVKCACHQASQPEFNPQYLHGGMRELILSRKVSSEFHMYAH